MFKALVTGSTRTLTEQLVCPAVERLAGSGILALFIVLDGSEVSQSPHKAPEVYLVLSRNQTQNITEEEK